MTAAQHPGVTALEERLRLLKSKASYWAALTDAAACDKHEVELVDAVKAAEASLAHFRERRKMTTFAIEDHQKRVAALEATIEAAKKDDLIAQALWLKLMAENHEAKRR